MTDMETALERAREAFDTTYAAALEVGKNDFYAIRDALAAYEATLAAELAAARLKAVGQVLTPEMLEHQYCGPVFSWERTWAAATCQLQAALRAEREP